MATDLADYTQAVNVIGGTVTISGTAIVAISGTPTVQVTGTPNVNIANVPAVTISSGSVTIANASIGVINAAGTKITSSRPPTRLGSIIGNNSGTPVSQDFVLPTDIQGVVFVLSEALTRYASLQMTWKPIGVGAPPWQPLSLNFFTQSVYVVPILPGTLDLGVNVINTVTVTLTGVAGFVPVVDIWAVYEANPLWLEFFAPPFAEPNQPPQAIAVNMTSNAVAYPIIPPVANVEIFLFDLAILGVLGPASVIAALDFEYGPSAAGPFTSLANGNLSLNAGGWAQGYPLLDFKGAGLGRGNGIYATSSQNNMVIDGYATYSLG